MNYFIFEKNMNLEILKLIVITGLENADKLLVILKKAIKKKDKNIYFKLRILNDQSQPFGRKLIGICHS